MCILSTNSPKSLQPLRIFYFICYLDQLQLAHYWCILQLALYTYRHDRCNSRTCGARSGSLQIIITYAHFLCLLSMASNSLYCLLVSGYPVLSPNLLIQQYLVTIAGGLKSLFAARLLIGYKCEVSVQFARVVQFQACCLRRELLHRNARGYIPSLPTQQ